MAAPRVAASIPYRHTLDPYELCVPQPPWAAALSHPLFAFSRARRREDNGAPTPLAALFAHPYLPLSRQPSFPRAPRPPTPATLPSTPTAPSPAANGRTRWIEASAAARSAIVLRHGLVEGHCSSYFMMMMLTLLSRSRMDNYPGYGRV